MTRGLYISATGMRTQMSKMDVLANNLANVDTTGFKRDSVATRSFTEELMMRIHDPRVLSPGMVSHSSDIGQFSSGVTVDEVFTDFSTGRHRAVSDPYAVAINGGGFFTVNVVRPTGQIQELYTRDGGFMLASDGTLMTKDGGYVQGQNGNIVIPAEYGEPTIDRNGNIVVNGVVVDSLRMVDFADYTTLRKVGDNYYDVTAQTQQAVFAGTIAQGYLEDSNINTVREMVEIINTSRIYEANQRFVTAMDQTLAKAVSEVGRK